MIYRWYYQESGRVLGPLDARALESLIASGAIAPETKVGIGTPREPPKRWRRAEFVAAIRFPEDGDPAFVDDTDEAAKDFGYIDTEERSSFDGADVAKAWLVLSMVIALIAGANAAGFLGAMAGLVGCSLLFAMFIALGRQTEQLELTRELVNLLGQESVTKAPPLDDD